MSVDGRGTDLLWPARGRSRSPMTPRLVGLAHLAATPLLLWSGACSTTDPCIAAGSRIATLDGWLAIELQQPGDSIYAVNVASSSPHVRHADGECDVPLFGPEGSDINDCA